VVKKTGSSSADKSGSAGSAATPIAPPVSSAADQVAIAGGDLYFKSADGTTKSWGSGELLGDGTDQRRGKPMAIADLATVKRLAVGGGQTMCAVMKDGAVKCWGNGASGELGDGKAGQSLKPVTVPGVANAAEIGIGSYYACALISDGTVTCWGTNTFHQASVEAKDSFVTPTIMPGIGNAKQIAVSGSNACALEKDGAVKCWGLDCGADGPNQCVKPYTVVSLAGVTSIAAGWQSVCAVMKDASVQCFGSNNEVGQLGTGTTESTASKITAVKGLSSVKELAAGQQHWCALMNDATVQCWGSNEFGQLGDGSLPQGDKGTFRASAAPVKALSDVMSLACGNSTCCAQIKDKSVKCWGANNELFGEANADTSVATPVSVPVM
jgi:alpha-tubulin suppressor-like RCC1 family protein